MAEEGLPVITDPNFIALDRAAQERAAMAALLEAGEDPTDPALVDRVIQASIQSPLWVPKAKRGTGGTLFRYKVATGCTDNQLAQALQVSRQAVNNWWHGQGERELTPRDKDLLLQQLLLQRRRIDAVIEELRQ